VFTGGDILFNHQDGKTNGARFEGGYIHFNETAFAGATISFRYAQFEGARVNLKQIRDWSPLPEFDRFESGLPQGLELPRPIMISLGVPIEKIEPTE